MRVCVPVSVPVCVCLYACVCGVRGVCAALRPKPTCQNASSACGFALWMCATEPEAALRKQERKKRTKRKRSKSKSRRTSTLKLTRTRTWTRTNAGVAAAWLAWGVCHERGVRVCVSVCAQVGAMHSWFHPHLCQLPLLPRLAQCAYLVDAFRQHFVCMR